MVQLCGKMEVVVIEARGLPNLDFNPLNKNDKSDSYCIVKIEGADGSKRLGKTAVIDDQLNPKWDHHINTNVDYDVSAIKFTVKDKDRLTSELMGSAFVETFSFLSGGTKYKGFLNLISPKGKPAGCLKVTVQFTGTEGKAGNSRRLRDKILVEKSSQYKNIPVTESKCVFLHGVLYIHIEKATNLPNVDTSILSIRKSDVSDPYVMIMIEDGCSDLWKVGVTSVVDNNLNPVWDEHFHINICHEVKSIKLIIRDKDMLSSDEIGFVSILGELLMAAKLMNGNFSIFSSSGKNTRGEITFSMQYVAIEDVSSSLEVPGCIFPMRELNDVTLYQDAHAISTNGENRRAWLDIQNALLDAKDYIYITGWSFHPDVSLLRFTNEESITIGEILLQKAEEGVQVCILLWNEATSTELNKEGLMSTADEITAEYFKNTKVTCSLALRKRKNTHLISTKQKFTLLCYSHHQKLVITDKLTNGIRHPVAFLGGLDLTKGRFDTPEHNLFKNLDTCYQKDFYNHIFDTKSTVGPRQPWHDVHCKIIGTVAFDLFCNFQERWKKQGTKESLKFAKLQPNMQLLFSSSQFSWNVQMFRSINSDSVYFSKPKGSIGIFVEKGRLFENSIHRAYIHNIRRSKKFIYIENQYFMGSSHGWFKDKNAGLSNLIPLEIVAHIEEKIRNRERFMAYIVIPMFPEGNPSNGEIKEMMFWQYRTIEMMYKRIALTLQAIGSSDHPQNYLLFFALAKREGGIVTKVPNGLQGFAANAFKNQRLMIYVHSKLAIFDDEYIIIGSANINDRSLSGNRDTEIAIGAYQPTYRCDSNLPSGSVSEFRKSLWMEHIGRKAPINHDPSNMYCIKKMKQLAEEGLGSFLAVNSFKAIRHLIIYPLMVHTDGKVTVRPDCPTIPDTHINFLGCRSKFIPTKLTS